MARNRNEQMSKRILLYARYSTEDQNPKSTAAQFRLCRQWLDQNGYTDAEIIEEADEGISGEILSRAGINAIRQHVAGGRFDLLVGEDVSRFFRDRSEPHKLAGHCVDHGCRFVAINDQIDTADPGWQRDLSRAADEHASSNEKTSARIKRASGDRWHEGQAMGPLVPGYRREPVDVENQDPRRPGPFVDAVDDRWVKVVREMFTRIARGERPISVAKFLDQAGFPRPHNARAQQWTANGVKALIRNPIFKGVERFGRTRQEKHYGSGKHQPERVPDHEVLHRSRPDLAMVDAALWQQANEAFDQRNKVPHRPRGSENPQYRVPRHSRTPLSGHFYCAICKGKMIGQGRAGGGYRCGNALEGVCWNRASALRDLTLSTLAGAISTRLLSLDGAADVLIQLVEQYRSDDGQLSQREQALRQEQDRLEHELAKLGEATLSHPDVARFADMLRERELRQRQVKEELGRIREQRLVIPEPVDRQAVLQAAQDLAQQVLLSDEGPDLLRQLTTPILAVPFQRVDCDLVVLRARFQFNLVRLLPQQWEFLLRGQQAVGEEIALISEPLELDLFQSPHFVRYAQPAMNFHRQHHGQQTPDQTTADLLGTSRRTLYDALKLGRLMEKRATDDPYVELVEAPEKASRWRQVGG